MIVDSGERRLFESGAVRDIQEGKGRCDLLPLDVVAKMFLENHKAVLEDIYMFSISGESCCLYSALIYFQNDKKIDLPEMLLEVSKHYEEGAKKYEERNWEKGIPAHCFVDSAVRHYLKHIKGDTDERHDRAFVWNILGLLWTQEHRPELMDLQYNMNKD